MSPHAESSFIIPFAALRMFCSAVLYGLFGFEVRGLEHLESVDGRVIMAGNHTGYLDGGMLLAACKRKFRFLMTEEVLGWGIVGKIVRHANVIILPKKNEKRVLVRVIESLRGNGRICIFPEGRLSVSGDPETFHDGVAFLHQQSGAPIVPFAISGGFEAWPEGRRFPRFRKIILQFGKPLHFAKDMDRKQITRLLKEKVCEMKACLDASNRRLAPVPVQRTHLP